MKPKVLLERFPYRFLETDERGWVEKFNMDTKRYKHMYECGCEMQMLTLLEDDQYVRWLDPEGIPCYRHQRGNVIRGHR